MSDDVTDLTHGVYRRIYAGYLTGQRINRLSLSAEAWFWRVYMSVDDFGNGRADPELCRAATAGLRRVTARQITGWLKEMSEAGLIELYTVKGERFLHIVGFEESQPAGKNGRRIRKFADPGESKGIQGDPDVVSASHSHSHSHNETDNHNGASAEPRSHVVEIYEFWKERMGKDRAQLTPEREQKILERLEDSTLEEIKAAIEGCKTSDFHMGRLPGQSKQNNSIEFICQNRGKLEYFVEMVPKNGNGHSARQPLETETENEKALRENCTRCYGTDTEVIPGKGAKTCDHNPRVTVVETVPV